MSSAKWRLFRLGLNELMISVDVAYGLLDKHVASATTPCIFLTIDMRWKG